MHAGRNLSKINKSKCNGSLNTALQQCPVLALKSAWLYIPVHFAGTQIQK